MRFLKWSWDTQGHTALTYGRTEYLTPAVKVRVKNIIKGCKCVMCAIIPECVAKIIQRFDSFRGWL